MVVVLHREYSAGTIGITLAGGADYECKEITVSAKVVKLGINAVCSFQVHKVINGSLADRDGRIQKGDRVLSINGRSTKGITHREALSILKVRTTLFVSWPNVCSPGLCCTVGINQMLLLTASSAHCDNIKLVWWLSRARVPRDMLPCVTM